MSDVEIICPVLGEPCEEPNLYNVSILRKAFFAYDTQMNDSYRHRVETCLRREGIKVKPFELPTTKDLVHKFRSRVSQADFVVADLSCWRRASSTVSNPNVTFETGLSMSIDKPVILLCKDGHKGTTDLQGQDQAILPARSGKKAWMRFETNFRHAIYEVQSGLAQRSFRKKDKRRVENSRYRGRFRMLDFLDMRQAVYNIEMTSGKVIHLNAGLAKFLDDATLIDLAGHLSQALTGQYRMLGMTSKGVGGEVMRFDEPTPDAIFDSLEERISAFAIHCECQPHIDILSYPLFVDSIVAPDFRYLGFALSPRQRLTLLQRMRGFLQEKPNYRLCIAATKLSPNEEVILKNDRFCIRLNCEVGATVAGTISWAPRDLTTHTNRVNTLLQDSTTIQDKHRVIDLLKSTEKKVQKL